MPWRSQLNAVNCITGWTNDVFRRSGSLCASEYCSFSSTYWSVCLNDVIDNFRDDIDHALKSTVICRMTVVGIPIRQCAEVSNDTSTMLVCQHSTVTNNVRALWHALSHRILWEILSEFNFIQSAWCDWYKTSSLFNWLKMRQNNVLLWWCALQPVCLYN